MNAYASAAYTTEQLVLPSVLCTNCTNTLLGLMHSDDPRCFVCNDMRCGWIDINTLSEHVQHLRQTGIDVEHGSSAEFEAQHAVAKLLLTNPQVPMGHHERSWHAEFADTQTRVSFGCTSRCAEYCGWRTTCKCRRHARPPHHAIKSSIGNKETAVHRQSTHWQIELCSGHCGARLIIGECTNSPHEGAWVGDASEHQIIAV